MLLAMVGLLLADELTELKKGVPQAVAGGEAGAGRRGRHLGALPRGVPAALRAGGAGRAGADRDEGLCHDLAAIF